MALLPLVLLALLGARAIHASPATPVTPVTPVSNATAGDALPDNAADDGNKSTNASDDNLRLVQAAVQRGCAARYTMTCLKLDALSVLSRMAVPASYDVLPGVTIHRQEQQPLSGRGAADIPGDLMRSLATDAPLKVDRSLDDYLMARFGNFLDSHTVQVHVLDLQPVASLRRALGATSDSDSTGRRRPNGIWQQLMGAGMMMGGSTLTMGLSALAAMAGKALMLSMLSLVLSALSGMSGGGGGGGAPAKQTTYEIISKPIYTHGHSHSAELHHEPSGPAAGYGLYGRAKDVNEGSLSAGTGASGVGGSAIGGPPGSAYITQFPRSLQETTAQITHQSKKVEDDKASSSSAAVASSGAAANYDSLLIRNLQYVKGQDGRAKYAIATPADLVPSESDYNGAAGDEVAASSANNPPRKYASHSHNHDDPSARSFQLSPEEEEEDGSAGVAGLAGMYEAGGGVLAGPRSMHTFARLPQMLVGQYPYQYQEGGLRTPLPPVLTSASSSFREPLPAELLPLSSPGSSWEAVTAAPVPATSTVRPPQVNPAFVVAKPVAPADRLGEDPASSAPAAPRTVAYRAYS